MTRKQRGSLTPEQLEAYRAKAREYHKKRLESMTLEQLEAYRERRRGYAKKYRDKRKHDPEFLAKNAAYVRMHYHKDIERSRARYRNARAARREERNAYDRAYYAAHRERRIAQSLAAKARTAAKLGITIGELERIRKQKND